MAAEHEELVAELGVVEKMPIVERLKLAKKRRAQQLKTFAQYEKQLNKETNTGRKSKKNQASGGGKTSAVKTNRLQFDGSILILDAAARNDLAEVKDLLKRGVNPDSCNEDGLTTLHQCCIDGLEDMMKLLLDSGANVNARDSERWTPLHAAATCGHVQLCRYLCDYGADLLAVNADGNMAYDLCEDVNTLDYIESEMAKRGVTQELIEETRMASENAMLSDMQNLANDGQSLEFRGAADETPLHVAACNGYVTVVEFLLSHGAYIHVTDKDNWQPIHCAICWGQMAAVKVLLEHGADMESTTRNGETALDLCDDLEMRQEILELMDELQNNRPHEPHGTGGPQRRNSSARRGSAGPFSSHAVVRRTSVHEKDAISAMDARKEAVLFREMMSAVGESDDDDDGQVLEAVTIKSPSVKSPSKPQKTSDVQIWLPSNSPTKELVLSPSMTDSLSLKSPSDASPTIFLPSSDSQPQSVKTPTDVPPAFAPLDREPRAGTRQTNAETPQTSPTTNNNGSQLPKGILLDLKKQRAREREERMHRVDSNSSLNGNAVGVNMSPQNNVSISPQNNVTAEGTGLNHISPLTIDDSSYVEGKRRKSSNRYDVAVNEKDDYTECCVLL